MNLTLSATRPLSGQATLAGDKSLSHRAALFAALARGTSVIDSFLVSGVTSAMLEALTALGVQWELDGCRLTVHGLSLLPRPVAGPAPRTAGIGPTLGCRNSATTIRMLAGALAACGIPCVLDGSDGLRKRPMDRVIGPLRRMGADIASANGCAPLALAARPDGRPLRAIRYALPVASAQVKSCLILAALAADGDTVLTEPGPSRDHTERMLAAMGARVESPAPLTVRVSPLTEPLAPLVCDLPGDISSAAFLMVAALLVPGSDILLRRIGVNPTRTGIIDALRSMGARIGLENPRTVCGEPVADIRVQAAPLHSVRIGGGTVVRMIDEMPALAAAACFADGATEISDAAELRYKETDRITTLCQELSRLGAGVAEKPDGFVIRGGTLRGGACDARGDHRLAMSLSLTGLAAPEAVTVSGAEILSESFPGFPAALRSLGADVA